MFSSFYRDYAENEICKLSGKGFKQKILGAWNTAAGECLQETSRPEVQKIKFKGIYEQFKLELNK